MATSVLAVVLLGLVASPGLLYREARQRRHPSSERRSGAENSLTLLVGTAATFVSLWVFAAVRWLLPDHTPDIGRLLSEPADYIKDHLPYLAVWSAGTYAAALALAFGSGLVMPNRRSGIRDVSSWWLIFGDDDQPKLQWRLSKRRSDVEAEVPSLAHKYVGCELIDGSYLSGYIYAYSTEVEETPDRDIVLVASITYLPAEPSVSDAPVSTNSGVEVSGEKSSTANPAELTDVGLAVVNASQIKFMTVTTVQSKADEGIGSVGVARSDQQLLQDPV